MDTKDLVNVHNREEWRKCVSKSSVLIPSTLSESRD